MEAAPPYSVGLVGDGDDVAAIENVEEAFGVTLDDQDAPKWLTAGDLFASLLTVLPPHASGDVSIWKRFAAALALETGVDPEQITRDSPLMLPDKGTWGHVKEALFIVALLWLVVLLIVVIF
jgi:hypothetical protein